MIIIFLICCFIQILFWGLIFGRFAFRSTSNNIEMPKEFAPVSVVICAHNEATNLGKNLTKVLSQNYPLYEVWVVNDASDDESALILADLSLKYTHLHVIHKKEKNKSGKKEALALGLKQAKFDWFLLTDADGVPASADWIRGMMAKALASNHTKMVLGYGPYFKYKGFVNLWIRYETAYVAVQYLSAALWGRPYMGVGRNLLYHRSLSEKHQDALTMHADIASGDDDLFVQAAAKEVQVEICTHPNTFVYSEPKHTFLALYKQKTRHYSTATRYKIVDQAFLLILTSSLLGFWCLLPFVFMVNATLVITAILVRICLVFIIWSKILSTLGDRALLKYILLLDFLMPIYFLIFAPSLFFKNRHQWK
jgi:biofilm PGA synthesis N-glycosyltransferase PgaC